jgi:hypothetical protein
VRFGLLIGGAVLSILAGLSALAVAVANWVSPSSCFHQSVGFTGPTSYSQNFVLVCRKTGPLATGTSPWVFLAIAVGLFALGVVLVRLANGTDRQAIAAR